MHIITLSRRWANPIIRAFFITVMAFIGLIGMVGRVFFVGAVDPIPTPLPIGVSLFLMGLGGILILLAVWACAFTFRDVRTRITDQGIARPRWRSYQLIPWVSIERLTITPITVALATSSQTITLTFEAFRHPDRLLEIIQEDIPTSTQIYDLRKP